MKFIAASTYLLMLLAGIGSGCAVNNHSDTVASVSGATEFSVGCARQIEREFRNPNHRARRIYSNVRTNGKHANCMREEK
jgi:hypothetical protein